MGYLSAQFAKDLDRLGFKPTRKIAPELLDGLEEALRDLADGESEVVLDQSARLYIRKMHERASGNPRRAPDFEEVVQGSCWLADPTNPREVAVAFDTSGDVPPAGLLCLGEWKSGELWVLDVAVKLGYVYLITERREIVPIFRNISDFAQWEVVNELWKRRLVKDGEMAERLSQIRFFRTVSYLREAGLVPPNFRPKRWKAKYHTPVALDKTTPET